MSGPVQVQIEKENLVIAGCLILSFVLALSAWVGFVVWKTTNSPTAVAFGMMFQQFCLGTSFFTWIIGVLAFNPKISSWEVLTSWLAVVFVGTCLFVWSGLWKTIKR